MLYTGDMNTMSPEEIAWIAGVFEGEGTFTYRTYSKTGRKQITMRIVMTDLDVIEKLHSITGIGNVFGPYVSKTPKKDGTLRKASYQWAVTKQQDIIDLCELLLPWFGTRRKEKFFEIKAYYKEDKQFATKKNGKWRGPQHEHHNNKTTIR